MKPVHRFSSVLALLVAVTLVLAACAPAATPTAEAPAATEATTEASDQPAEPATETTAEPIQITFWNYWDGTNGEAIQALVDEFNQSHPDIKVTNTFVGWGELLPKLQTATAGGEQPDVAAVDLVWMPTMAQSGAVASLDDYIAASAVELDDFYPALLNTDRYDDVLYGLPVSTNNLELFYNKDLFNAAGLDPNTPPQTWDELSEMAQVCADPAQGVVGMELYTEAGEGLTWQYQVYLWQAGGAFLSEDLHSAAFNSPEGERALQYWVDLIDSGGYKVSSWGLFGQGKACMVLDGSWMVGGFDEAPFDWGTALMPYPTDGQPATNMGGEHLILFKSDEARQQSAWEFINWLTSTETQLKWVQATRFMPIRKSVADDPAYAQWLEETEIRLEAFAEGQQYAKNRPPISNYSEVSDIFSREIEKALLGEVSAADALSAAETAVNDLLSN